MPSSVVGSDRQSMTSLFIFNWLPSGEFILLSVPITAVLMIFSHYEDRNPVPSLILQAGSYYLLKEKLCFHIWHSSWSADKSVRIGLREMLKYLYERSTTTKGIHVDFSFIATPHRLTPYKSIKYWTQEHRFSQQVIEYMSLIKLVTSLTSGDFNSFLLPLYHLSP